MAPTGRRTGASRPKTAARKQPTRTIVKKKPAAAAVVVKKPKQKIQKTPPPPSSPCKSSSLIGSIDFEPAVDDDQVSAATCSPDCSTPKAQRFRIPKIVSCPPAPKKPRVTSNCLFRRSSPIAFFAPPDLELFFHYAKRGISV